MGTDVFDANFQLVIVISSLLGVFFVMIVRIMFCGVLGGLEWFFGELVMTVGYLLIYFELFFGDLCLFEIGLSLVLYGFVLLYIGFEIFFYKKPSYWLFILPSVFLLGFTIF